MNVDPTYLPTTDELPRLHPGDATPWGDAQQVTRLADGCYFVSTAGHGGMWLAPEHLHRVPQPVQDWASRWSKGWGPQWLEEDCVICAGMLIMADAFTEKDLERCRDFLAVSATKEICDLFHITIHPDNWQEKT